MKLKAKFFTLVVLSAFALQTAVFAAPAKKTAKPTEQQLARVKAALPTTPTVKPAKPRRLLVFDKCKGYFHRCIPLADATFVMMGEKSGAFKADVSSDMAVFTPQNLAKYDAILLNNTTKLDFSPEQKKALLDFVKGGKGFVGIHAASDNFYGWPEAAAMIGGQFNGHPWHANGTWAVKIDEPNHPLNRGFGGKGFMINDEIYQIKGNYSRESQLVLLSLDMDKDANKHVKGIKRKDNDFGIAWIKPFGKGRVFYCSLGHNNHIYWNRAILQHYLDGIQYALGDLKVNDIPVSKKQEASIYHQMLKYEFGGDKSAFDITAQNIRTAKPADLVEIESNLDAVLTNPEATAACKGSVCRLLRRCASEKSVPALSALLNDKEVSHMARFALQWLDSPAVDSALRKALTSGSLEREQLIGVIGTIGQRRDSAATSDLAKLLSSDSKDIAAAAIIALGHIGDPAAVAALISLPTAGSDPLIENSLLEAAEHLKAAGSVAASRTIYNRLYSDKNSDVVRIAALRGLFGSDAIGTLPTLIGLLNNGSDILKKEAVVLLGQLPAGEKETRAITRQMPKLSPEISSLLMATLAHRNDAAATTYIKVAVASDNQTIRQAAIRALGDIDSTDSISVLIDTLKKSGSDADVAAQTLSRMRSAAVNPQLYARFSADGTPEELRCEIIGILAKRPDADTAKLLVKSLTDSNASVSKAAAAALGETGGVGDISAILQIMKSSDDAALRRSLERAVSKIALRSKSRDKAAAPVVAVLNENTDPEIAKSLIAILRRTGGKTAEEALSKLLASSSDTDIRRETVKALSVWGDASPAEALYGVMQSESNNTVRALAFRGYVSNLARKADDKQALEMSRKALVSAKDNNERKLVLGILGSIHTVAALELAAPMLDNTETATEAEVAYASIAFAIAKNNPADAEAAIEKVAQFKNNQLAADARKLLEKK